MHVPAVNVTPSFFDLLGVRAEAGRVFTDADRDGTLPVVIVNRSFERRFFAGRSAVGRQLRVDTAVTAGGILTIVGVVPDLFAAGVHNRLPEAVYRPVAQAGPAELHVMVRAATTREAAAALRVAVAAVDPDMALDNSGTLQLLFTAALASFVPAWRAARVDPLRTLRSD